MSEFDVEELSRLRKPPQNIDAEQSLLGGLLIDNRAWDRVGDLLQPGHFYRHEHRQIFGAIAGLIAASKPADPVTVSEALMRGDEQSVSAADMGYLNALQQSVPSAANARRYAEIVVERALERAMVAAGDEAATIAFGPGPALDKLDRIATLMRNLESKAATGHGPRLLREILTQRIDHINALHEGGEESTGAAWKTPLAPLNRLLSGGMRPGRVYVLAARPSIGKSALAQTLAIRFASDRLPVLFLSQEMPDTELADRIIAQVGAVDFGHLQSAQLSDEEWSGLSYGVDFAGKLPFFVDDQGGLTIGQIRAKARAVPNLRVLVVDYLQLTASTSARPGGSNRNSEIEEVSRGLKTLAKELGIAVVLLSQLNREVEKRPGKRPMLGDLRDSGAIEQDADVVLLLWPLQESATEGCSMLGVHVAKNRGGAKGEFPLCFWGRHMRFGEAALPMTHYTQKPTSTGSDL